RKIQGVPAAALSPQVEGGRAECATEGMDSLSRSASLARSAFETGLAGDAKQIQSFPGHAGVANRKNILSNARTKRVAVSAIPSMAARDGRRKIRCKRRGTHA